MSKKKEAVDHPSHYQTNSGIEVIDVIEAFSLGFCDGNSIKYILRGGMNGRNIYLTQRQYKNALLVIFTKIHMDLMIPHKVTVV